MKLFFIAILLMLTICSCTTIKEYEKVNINDPDMSFSSRPIDRYEINFQLYRESAAGANGGKSGGGCGCN